MKLNQTSENEKSFENEFVHTFYSEKSKKFSDSRVKPWPFTVKFMKEYVKENDLILDSGCGNGRQFMHSNTVGVDFSENLLLDALSKLNIGLIKADIHTLPFTSSSFDVVLSIAVIHHLSTPERRRSAMEEMKRVLKPDGICLIYLWHKDASKKAKFCNLQKSDLKLIKEKEVMAESEYLVSWRGEMDLLRYYCLFDESMLKSLAEECEMKIIEITREEESIYAILKK